MNTLDEQILRNVVLKTNESNFNKIALAVFNFQYTNNETYHAYCNLLKIIPSQINEIEKIPFLPIQFFKTKEIKSTAFDAAIIFESSGTTGSINSNHFVKDISIYEESFLNAFNHFYGTPSQYCIIGLLPSYLERKGSSLVYMVDDLIKKTNHTNSGFYLYDFEKLKTILQENETAKQPTILIGVTYALLDFAEKHKMQLKYTTIMETGGMKGRREELSRTQVHAILQDKLGVKEVHSEYGMTELLSQAYSNGKGIFDCPSQMKILIRSEDDPFEIIANISTENKSKTGAINIIDLANLYSCSFIATDDLGKLYSNKSFEITGRMENSDVRGCGLMII
jgi:phenylacetate-coenzyme A ligase PaaK-like adenylate-forming protein